MQVLAMVRTMLRKWCWIVQEKQGGEESGSGDW